MASTTLQLTDRVPIPKTDVSVPRLGFGTYSTYGADCEQACLAALRTGYRHFDSAQLYRNEANVQAALAQSDVKREDVFLSTKITRALGGLDQTYESVLGSVEKLGGTGGYVDLFLVHTPASRLELRQEIWAALEKAKTEGKTKAIGVSNFRVRHLEEMKEYAQVWPPHVNQIELHPWCQQRALVDYCRENGIVVQAYSPLATGARLDDPELGAVAAKHGKQPAQILIRWSMQKGWFPLPKSQTPANIEANANVFDFALDEDDMSKLDSLDLGAAGAVFPANVS